MKIGKFIKGNKNYIFLTLLVLLAIKVFIPQLDDLKESLLALKDADMAWVLAGIAVYFSGIPALAYQIVHLALKPLRFVMTCKVEMAGQFVNKLLPSFVGVFTLNMYYLTKKGHSLNQATTVMTANALASGVAYSCLIILALVFSSVPNQNLVESIEIPTNLIFLIGILLAGACYVVYRSAGMRSKMKSQYQDVKANLRVYRKRPLSMLIAVVCNGLGSAANIFALYASAQAVGVDISFATALLAYTFCNIAVTLVPTPGGLGAAEAGIYAGLVLAGVEGTDAILVTLLYRLTSASKKDTHRKRLDLELFLVFFIPRLQPQTRRMPFSSCRLAFQNHPDPYSFRPSLL
jgi:glycosyltransferase 2 family protein